MVKNIIKYNKNVTPRGGSIEASRSWKAVSDSGKLIIMGNTAWDNDLNQNKLAHTHTYITHTHTHNTQTHT